VGDEPGITRDRIYGEYEWSGRRFRVVDTGGIVPDDPELIPTEIYNQARVALDEADALVLGDRRAYRAGQPTTTWSACCSVAKSPSFWPPTTYEGGAMESEAQNLASWVSAMCSLSAEHGLGSRRPARCHLDAIPVSESEQAAAEAEPEAAEPEELDETDEVRRKHRTMAVRAA